MIALAVVYGGAIAILNIPYVQKRLSLAVADELSALLSTKVEIERIDLGLLNRVIIQNISVEDQDKKEMFHVSRFSAKYEITPLLRGQIRISSVQLFGLRANLAQKDEDTEPNFKFVLDAFASKDTVKKDLDLDLRINTILIRRGQIHYDLLSAEQTPEKFNAKHIGINNISATLSLKAFNSDTINAQIRRMSMNEQSGLQLKKLTAKVTGNNNFFLAENVLVAMPESEFSIDTLEAMFDSIPNLANIGDDARYWGRIHSHLTPSDIKAFLPTMSQFDDPIYMRISFNGQGNKAQLDEFMVHNDGMSFVFSANCTARDWQDQDSLYIAAEVKQAEITPEGMGWVTRNMTGEAKVPTILKSNRYVRVQGNMSGKINRLSVNGSITTDAGQINANGTMHVNEETGGRQFSGKATSRHLNLATLTGENKDLGKATFDVELKGFSYEKGAAQTYITGLIDSIDYKGYRYHNISLDGQYRPGAFNGQINIDDPNGSVEINGQFATQDRIPNYNLTARINNFRPNDLHLTEKHAGTSFSLNINANFTGRDIDDFIGELTIDSLTIDAMEADKCWFMEQLKVEAGKHDDGKNFVSLTSPFIVADVEGDYSYRTLPESVKKLLRKYIPSFNQTGKVGKETHNNFTFHVAADNTELLSKLFDIPLELRLPASIKGVLDDENDKVNIWGNAPEFIYDGSLYESASILCSNNETNLQGHVRVNKRMKKGATMSLSLDAAVENEKVNATVNWGNNTNNSYYGKVAATATFRKDETVGKMATHIDLHPSSIVLNDTVWHIHPSEVDIAATGNVTIKDFLFEHEDNFIKANGVIGKTDADSCLVGLNNIDIQYIIDMVQFKAVKFNGLISGNVMLRGVTGTPVIDGRLYVKDLALNDGLLGDADITAWWDEEVGGVRMNAYISEERRVKSEGSMTAQTTIVNGFVSPKMDGLDLNIDARGTNLEFLGLFVNGIFTDMTGKAYGNVRLYGPFSDLDLEGDVSAQASVLVDILNCRMNAIADSVSFRSGVITFKDIQLTDNENHTGVANGTLRHTKLKNLLYDFSFSSKDMLVFNYSKETPDFPFYGRIYASGNVSLRGGNNQLYVDGSLRSGPKTTFTYVTATALEAVSTQFITFVDKTPRREAESVSVELYHHSNQTEEDDDDDELETDMYVNLLVEATPDATMKIIMDPIAGDYISASGSGVLQAEYYNKGDFNMYGNYIVDRGVYKMSMQSVIRKDFTLQSGGNVAFNGDPRKANVNVQAVYTVNSASLDDLVADASSSKGSIRVNCIVNLTGNLTDPDIKFDLELPTVSDEDQELVRSVTNTEEQMNTQIIYLLGVGKFYTNDYAGNSGQSNVSSSLAMNTLSGQLNDILSDVIDNQNWNFGTNISTGTNGWSDMEAEAILSGSLLNNRLIINGNFGYRDNPMRNTNFVGDFEALWLLTKNGELSLKGYNQTNDRYFTKSTLTTQGIGLIYKKEFNTWGELTAWLLKNRNKIKKKDDNHE